MARGLTSLTLACAHRRRCECRPGQHVHRISRTGSGPAPRAWQASPASTRWSRVGRANEQLQARPSNGNRWMASRRPGARLLPPWTRCRSSGGHQHEGEGGKIRRRRHHGSALAERQLCRRCAESARSTPPTSHSYVARWSAASPAGQSEAPQAGAKALRGRKVQSETAGGPLAELVEQLRKAAPAFHGSNARHAESHLLVPVVCVLGRHRNRWR